MTLPNLKPVPKPDWTDSLSQEQVITMKVILTKASHLGVELEVFKQPPVSVGPIVTTYHVVPIGRSTVSSIENLSDDLAVVLGAEAIQIMRYPGDSFISIGVPNSERKYVMWRDHCTLDSFNSAKAFEIPMFLGITQHGDQVWEDLTQCPHLLIAGTTGSGKSTWIRSVLTSLALSKINFELFISDTKMVEFKDMIDLPGFKKRETDIQGSRNIITDLLRTLKRRTKELEVRGLQNIHQLNKIYERWTYILFVIDELADLTTDTTPVDKDDSPTGRKTTQGKLCIADLNKLARLSRATGIHIIAGTQRPSVNVVDGSIKANFPARISFRLPSQTDSRVILDQNGAEHLLLRGDMLYISPNQPGIRRIHAPFATAEDIKQAIEFSKRRF